MKTRILTAALLIPLVVGLTIHENSWPLFVMLLVATALGLHEFYLVLANDYSPPRTIGMVTGIICFGSAFLFRQTGLLYTLILSTFFVIFSEVLKRDVKNSTQRVALVSLANFYIPCFLSFALFIKSDFPQYLLLVLLLTTWATDSFAYFFGVALGKHRLIPEISPKKSIEGALFGTLFGAITFIASYTLLIKQHSLLTLLFIGCILSVVAQIGDLFASLIKRDCDIKDFSNLFPGHGGMLDRIDSLLFVFPAAFYIGKIFKL